MLQRARLLRRGFTTSTGHLKDSLQEAVHRGAPIDIHPEVEHALRTRAAVVALESTIITHGMPYPTNLTTARSVESIVRSTGAVPATIGLIHGRVKIGLEPSELERLADVENNRGVFKLSRRDLGPAIALKRDGGTTCSSTLIFAALAGIKVFSTGGLGGVHRGGESSMDVSADLHELTRCPVGLVSSGVKSILDIGRTLEYLETLGVPVVTYGPTDDFPAFYSRRSGFKSPWRADQPNEAARLLQTHYQLGMSTGALFGVPIPMEYEAVGEELQASVEQAVQEAEENGMSRRGKEATPWLLKRVGELTKGKSLLSNVALIENTALVGGQIAMAYAKLEEQGAPQANQSQPSIPTVLPPSSTVSPKRQLGPVKLMVIGSAAVDITAHSSSTALSTAQSTSPGSITLSLGGVGRNVAEAAHRALDWSFSAAGAVQLVSALGQDSFGRLLRDETERMGMRVDGLLEADMNHRTAACNLVLDSAGALVGGVADMEVVQALDGKKLVDKIVKEKPMMVALDGNMSESSLTSVLRQCVKSYTPVFFEPTSVAKATRILPAIASALDIHTGQSPVAFASPNLLELAALYHATQAEPLALTEHAHWWDVTDALGLGADWRMAVDAVARQTARAGDASAGTLDFLVRDGAARMAVGLLPFYQRLVIKCGARGVLVALRVVGEARGAWAPVRSNTGARIAVSHAGADTVVLRHFPALAVADGEMMNSTGAGDSLVGSLLADLVRDPGVLDDPHSLERAVNRAQRAAILTLQSPLAVSPLLSELV